MARNLAQNTLLSARTGKRKSFANPLHPSKLCHTVLVHTSARNDAVDVRMIEQVGAPCMKNAGHASLQSLCVEEFLQRSPYGTEHTAVEQCLPGHGDGMKAVGNGEYDMEVFYSRHNFLLAHLNPHLTLLVLTLGAMAVTATVVADMYLATLRTHLDMTAECPCTAYGHCAERLPDLRNYRVFGIELTAPVPDYLSDLKSWAWHS